MLLLPFDDMSIFLTFASVGFGVWDMCLCYYFSACEMMLPLQLSVVAIHALIILAILCLNGFRANHCPLNIHKS